MARVTYASGIRAYDPECAAEIEADSNRMHLTEWCNTSVPDRHTISETTAYLPYHWRCSRTLGHSGPHIAGRCGGFDAPDVPDLPEHARVEQGGIGARWYDR